MTEPVWKLKFYGVRGSIPVSRPGCNEFGGDTTCFYVDLLRRKGKEKITVVFDAGTGIRQLGKDMLSGVVPNTEHTVLLFTHFHWDHIQGFPFFLPAYFSDRKLYFYSPSHCVGDSKHLESIFSQQMQQEFFPVQLENMGSQLRFYTDEEFTRILRMDPNVTMTNRRHQHPGGAYSYRLEGYGKSIVICTDLEHGETIDEEVVTFCQGADVLVHEAQYTTEQLVDKRGWGHSSYEQALEVAERAGVGQLYITHHDPDHDDDFLLAQEAKCQARFPNCFLARQGMEVVV
ncbi:MAG: MBL fold metallo-hydrolase [Bacteroidota bacterium]